ncbi:MAG TPA: ATPase domain-containing protein [Methylibium sp.]|uniref:ATPase domain-containing protein n=1 Tax=Methylibium sp. TaxID=2067992 RepID=UPI002DB56AB1|nr:ATPase domain-containing protein [Methylibium sp.]HEU4460057.1 ATPase domain-containing protein [Methylibium sp.]
MTNLTINRLRTGVKGLDEVLGGGLPEMSFNLIAGEPGCGKTTLAHQMMFAMVGPGRSAIYFTVLGEPPLKMLRYQQQFSFFDEEAVNRSVRFVSLAREALAGDLQKVLARIVEEVTTHSPAFVFVDSFRSVILSSDRAGDATGNHLQQFVQELGVQMASWQATTFLIGEYHLDDEANPVSTVADGIVWLRQSVKRNSMVRKIEVMKMRGQHTLPGLHTFRMSGDGVEVFPPARPPMAAAAGFAAPAELHRLSVGVPVLDEMLGGGLPDGYSLLVAGPSGSGKSILAAAFLAEGARHGETGVLASFERGPARPRVPVLAELIRKGSVGVVQHQALDLSIDEVLLLLLRESRRIGAKRVVIDSLSGFELSVAPTFREDFRESLSRMVAALTTEGLTVLMTSELEDRYNDLRFSPYGTAFLTDAIIVQRYIEIAGRLRRLLAVVKVRGSAHSDQLRLYAIDAAGLHVGDPLDDFVGLLGGRPSPAALRQLPLAQSSP